MAATTERVIVPKTLSPPEFDRAQMLERLFALPLPPRPADDHGGGRPYPITTPLGRIMRLKGLKVQEVGLMPDCPNYRVLSDYLAKRKPISPRHRGALAKALGVDSRIL